MYNFRHEIRYIFRRFVNYYYILLLLLQTFAPEKGKLFFRNSVCALGKIGHREYAWNVKGISNGHVHK